MLIQNLLSSHENYERSLKQRLAAAIALLCVGLVGFACWFWLVPGSNLSDHAQYFYLGAASGISSGALVLLARTAYLMTHPEARKKARIKESDEREQHIIREAAQFAGVAAFIAATAILFVVIPFNVLAAQVLIGVMAIYSLAFLAANAWLSKKL